MKVKIEQDVIAWIAAAIRSRNGTSDMYYPSEMPEAIRDIPVSPEHFREVFVEGRSEAISHCDAGKLIYSWPVPVRQE